MKRNKILPFCLILLTSFAMVGCDDNSNTTAYIQRITLNANADTVIIVGEEINIDDYINLLDKDSAKIAPSDSNYTITITNGSDLGSLTDHTFKASKEGTISLTISSSQDASIKASLDLTAVSSLKKQFITDTEGVTNTYTLEALAYDASGNLEIDDYGFVGEQTGTIHSSDFFAIVSDDSTYGYLTGSDSETYYFSCSDRFGTDLVVSPGPTGTDLSNYYVAQDFPISAISDTKTSVDEDGNTILELSQEATESFIQYGLGYSVSRITQYYSILPSQIDYQPVTFYDMNGNKVQKEMPIIYTFISYTSNGTTTSGLLNASILEVGQEYGLKVVDDYISTIGIPDPIEDPGVDTAIKAVEEGQNYTKKETFGWFKASVTDDDSFGDFIPTDVPESMSDDIASFFPRSSTPSVSTVYATQDKVKEEFESGYGNLTPEAKEGETVTNGHYIYSVNSADASKVDITTNITVDNNTLKLTDADTTESKSKGDSSTYKYISSTKGLGGASFSSDYIASATTKDDTTTVILNSGQYASSLLDTLVTNSSYNRLGLLSDWTQLMWGSSLADAVSTVGMLSDVIINYTKSGDSYTDLSVSACLVWNTNTDGTYTVVRWLFEFSNIGTTIIE